MKCLLNISSGHFHTVLNIRLLIISFPCNCEFSPADYLKMYTALSITNEKNRKSIVLLISNKAIICIHNVLFWKHLLLPLPLISTKWSRFFPTSIHIIIDVNTHTNIQAHKKNTTEIDCSPIPRTVSTQIHTQTSKIF